MNSFFYKKYIDIKEFEKKLMDRMMKSDSELTDKVLHILFDILQEWREEHESDPD